MTSIVATFRVTTPMFSAGADTARAELRALSFKGVLRFWWRACAWSHFGGDLAGIREEETRVFGGPEIGQSRVGIRLYPVGRVRVLAPHEVLTDAGGRAASVGARYLAYGMLHTAGNVKKGVREAELIRGCLAPPFELTVELRLRKLVEAQRGLLIEAVRALGTFGGMGARSRRGYGSLSLLSVDGDPAPALPTQVHDLASHRLDQLPEYTALSSCSRLLIGQHPVADALVALNQLGAEYKDFRESKMDGDAAIVLNGKPANAYPKRVAFGLPLNYGDNKPVVEPAGHGYDRRASPLFFHIHDCAGRAVPVISFLPARFLPTPKLSIRGGKKPPRTVALPEQPDVLYQPVNEFLDYLSRPGGSFEAVREEAR